MGREIITDLRKEIHRTGMLEGSRRATEMDSKSWGKATRRTQEDITPLAGAVAVDAGQVGRET